MNQVATAKNYAGLKIRFDRSDRGANPIHSQVGRVLSDMVEKQFHVGDQFPSDRDLVKLLKVSQPTVRSAVRELVRRGLLERRLGRGGTIVRQKNSVQSVGLVLPDYPSGTQAALIRQVAEACARKDYALNLYLVQKRRPISEIFRHLQRSPTEERILAQTETVVEATQLNRELLAGGYRGVFLHAAPDDPLATTVAFDETMASKVALDYLRKKGHRDFVFLINEPHQLEATARRIASLQRWQEENPSAHVQLVDCHLPRWENSFTAAEKKTRQLLKASRSRPSAILAVSANGAAGALRAAVKSGIRVPQDISIMALDQIFGWETYSPRPTCIAEPIDQLIRTAFELLWSDEPKPGTTLLKPKLIEGETVG